MLVCAVDCMFVHLHCVDSLDFNLASIPPCFRHEIVNVNLKNKPDWLFERNPLGLVPVIEYKGHYIYESGVCDEFLEDLSDANALLPSCAFKRAAARLFMTLSDKKV